FMPGIPGQYFKQFGMTVAVAVAFSLLVARLITPLLAAYFMRAGDGHEHHDRDGRVMRSYSWLVTTTSSGHLPLLNPLWILKPLFGRVPGIRRAVASWHFGFPARYLTLMAAVALLMVSLHFMAKIPGGFMPVEDVSRV